MKHPSLALKLFCGLLLTLALSACGMIKPEATPTPSATFTPVPPTHTPTRTSTPTITLTPTPTDTPTPTPEIPSEISAELGEIQAQVSAIRGLAVGDDFLADVWTQAQVEQYLTRRTRIEYPEMEQIEYQITYGFLGMLDPTSPILMIPGLYTDLVFGFYEPEQDTLVLLHDYELNTLGRFAYAHELVYAMLDQMVDIDGNFGVNDDNCDQYPDRCLALRALLEGDAAFTTGQWLAAHTTAVEQAELVAQSQPAEIPGAPLAFLEGLAFPATRGTAFVSYLWEQGGWEAINQAYQNPPQSSEQIMHPERYPADIPLEVTLPDLLPVLGEGWEMLDQNTLGEWNLYLMLTSGMDPQARQEAEPALEAVTGWGGDLYSIYFHSESGEIFLVSKVLWETSADAREFLSLLNTHVTARFDLDDSEVDLINMFGYLGLWYAHMDRSGDTTYYILSPSAELSELVHAAVLDE